MGPLVYPFAKGEALGFRQSIDGLADVTATAFIAGSTFRALDEQQMTAFIAAIGVGIGRAAALMTAGDDLAADAFAKAVVEYEILSFKFIFQPLFPDGIGIVDNAAFEMINVCKSLMQ